MAYLADLCVRHDVVCLSDEVYEWLVYDENEHVRIGKVQLSWSFSHKYSQFFTSSLELRPSKVTTDLPRAIYVLDPKFGWPPSLSPVVRSYFGCSTTGLHLGSFAASLQSRDEPTWLIGNRLVPCLAMAVRVLIVSRGPPPT